MIMNLKQKITDYITGMIMNKSIDVEISHELVAKLEFIVCEQQALLKEMYGSLNIEGQFLTLRGMLPMPDHIIKSLKNYEKLKQKVENLNDNN